MKGEIGLRKGNAGDLLRTVAAGQIEGARLRYFDCAMASFVTILLLSNVLGAGKVAVIDLPGIGDWPFGAGILFFPLGYVLGDVLTEVYRSEEHTSELQSLMRISYAVFCLKKKKKKKKKQTNTQTQKRN